MCVIKNKNMKLKYKFLLSTIGLTILLVATQGAMQFMSSYKFVGFVEKNETSWIGIAGQAQAEKLSCLQEVEQLKSEKEVCIKAINGDIIK